MAMRTPSKEGCGFAFAGVLAISGAPSPSAPTLYRSGAEGNSSGLLSSGFLRRRLLRRLFGSRFSLGRRSLLRRLFGNRFSPGSLRRGLLLRGCLLRRGLLRRLVVVIVAAARTV